MSELIRSMYEQGYSSAIYDGVVVLAFVVQLLFLLWYRKKFELSIKQAVVVTVLVYPLSYLWMLVLAWVANGFTNWGANNIIRLYVWVPLIAWPVGKLLKMRFSTICDFLAPSMALQQAIGHSVCPFAGCCHGYPCEWGVYNPVYEMNMFPNQWLECLVALGVFVAIMRISKKHGYLGYGGAYPWFLVLFGGTRFLLEFLRDNEKLFFGISDLAIWALLMVVVGLFWLSIVREHQSSKGGGVTTKRAKR